MSAIYRDYDQQGLDQQYERLVAPDSYAIFDRWRSRSDESAARRPATLDIAYGPSETEKLDVFPSSDPNGPILIYIHGGYWIWKDKVDFRFVAEGVVDEGVNLVVINYALTPHVDMDEIVRQVRAAVAFVWKNAGGLIPGDRSRLFLSGHSAGGHLTGIAAATDWPAFDPELPAEIVAGGVAISGLYDLEPIRLSYLNETVGLDAAMARRNSPIHHVKHAMPPLTLVVGGAESDEFKRQQAAFAAALEGAGGICPTIKVAGLHHFAVIETIADKGSVLQQAVLERVGLL
ncbi:alpha/beta hydrolase [Kaistia dalseonensis]|uniref:Arylformamidase n=1 Tax=Kaistia dalseonensis TaxID=410840 RepID=A0ABU0H8U3_9HYPH|nr:alpha/beta hydrolase [Kaistia dalseonensis]MCX5496121.1 alpha/beta hydrolase [Kaistia dalseonensis]MDQ0438729.1 arylformamidase [Kaistia dalseonensis]